MRVLHLAPGASRPGGIATYASRFAASVRDAGVDVQSRDVAEEGLGPLRGFSLVHAELGGACRHEFRALERLARTREAPFVATLHDPPRCVWRPDTPAALGRSRAASAAVAVVAARPVRRAEAAVARAAEGLLVMSEVAKPGVRRVLRLGDEARLRTIPHPRLRPPGPAAPPAARGELTVGFHGFWFGGKGLDVLVDALALLRDDARPVRARLWGEPPPGSPGGERYRAGVLRRIRRRGIGHLVTVEGPIAPEALPATLRTVDLVVLPHRSDALTYRGLTAVSGALEDALGAGVPVVASGVRAFAEQLRPGVDGLVVAPDDPGALARVLRRVRDDPRLLARLWAGAATAREAPEPGEVARSLYEEVLA